MKLLNFLDYSSAAASLNTSNKFSRRQFYTVLAITTFFLLITAQFFWATIHGDGAVYAWVTRKISENGILSARLPSWTQTEVFAEHPYLFFYFTGLFTYFFGFSDLVMKLPNFLIAGISIWTVYRVCYLRDGAKERSYQIGLTAGYALILNAAYALQISQPTLDPLAQLLAFFAPLILIYYRNAFLAGLILGLAFLTKGLEMLPNLAALFFLTCYLDYRNLKSLGQNLALGLVGLALPVGFWLGYDFYVWKSQWLNTYIERQFQNRLLTPENMKNIFGFDYVWTFARVYCVEILIITVGFFKSVRSRRQDPLFFYFIFYLFFQILAFLIIKKDSSQHLTGVLLVGSVFVGEYIWEGLQKVNRSFLRALPVFLCLAASIYWGLYIFRQNDKPDLWTSIRNESASMTIGENNLPFVIKNSTQDIYGMFNTAQWYFTGHKVYLQPEADQLLEGKEVYLLSDSDGWKLVKEKTIYKKGSF